MEKEVLGTVPLDMFQLTEQEANALWRQYILNISLKTNLRRPTLWKVNAGQFTDRGCKFKGLRVCRFTLIRKHTGPLFVYKIHPSHERHLSTYSGFQLRM